MGRGYAGGVDECWEGRGWGQGDGVVSNSGTPVRGSEGQWDRKRELARGHLGLFGLGGAGSSGQVDRKSQTFKTVLPHDSPVSDLEPKSVLWDPITQQLPLLW